MSLSELSKKELLTQAKEKGIEASSKLSKEKLINLIQVEEDKQMSAVENEVVETEVTEAVEKMIYTLDDGTECSRSAFIRQEFNKGLSRQELAKSLDVKYYVVYAATANMFNEAHPEGGGSGTGRGSISVPKVNAELKFVNAEGVVVETAEEAAQVQRVELMKELAEAGVSRSTIKEYFGVAYATVYAATKGLVEGSGARERKFVTDPETGVEMKRADYIRKLYETGMDRRAIAKQLTNITGDLVDYATVWAATKPKKPEVVEEATEAVEETEEA